MRCRCSYFFDLLKTSSIGWRCLFLHKVWSGSERVKFITLILPIKCRLLNASSATFQVLQSGSKLVKILTECQTASIRVKRWATRRLIRIQTVCSYWTMVAIGRIRLVKTDFPEKETIIVFFFQLICSYVLYPLSYFMGVETADCRKVAELVGKPIAIFTSSHLIRSSRTID